MKVGKSYQYLFKVLFSFRLVIFYLFLVNPADKIND